MSKSNVFKHREKLTKIAELLDNYLTDWLKKDSSPNCFYYATLQELDDVKTAIRGIESGSIRLSSEGWRTVKSLATAKEVTFGKYYHKF